jgi:hypothetical protein
MENKVESQITSIVSTLAAKVHQEASRIFSGFNIDALEQIPFQLLTPEKLVEKIYPPNIQEYLLDSLKEARKETEDSEFLIEDLLAYIAPLYSPKYGCCIPCDPKLAANLIQIYTWLERNIAYNFLYVEGDDLYGQTWLEGNIAALLLHEKYGHGFFYTQTKLGQQLAIIYRYDLLRKIDSDRLRSPYLRSIHQEYGEVIQMLDHSTLLLNEGFATWVELTGLQRLSGIFGQTVHRRKDFLFSDTHLDSLVGRSEYLKRFNPGPGSKYEITYDRFKTIQNFFKSLDPDFGVECAVQAMYQAANVDFGISEQDGEIQFKLGADEMKEMLLDDDGDYIAGADRRIRRIWRTLKDYSEHIDPNGYRKQVEQMLKDYSAPLTVVSE